MQRKQKIANNKKDHLKKKDYFADVNQ